MHTFAARRSQDGDVNKGSIERRALLYGARRYYSSASGNAWKVVDRHPATCPSSDGPMRFGAQRKETNLVVDRTEGPDETPRHAPQRWNYSNGIHETSQLPRAASKLGEWVERATIFVCHVRLFRFIHFRFYFLLPLGAGQRLLFRRESNSSLLRRLHICIYIWYENNCEGEEIKRFQTLDRFSTERLPFISKRDFHSPRS